MKRTKALSHKGYTRGFTNDPSTTLKGFFGRLSASLKPSTTVEASTAASSPERSWVGRLSSRTPRSTSTAALWPDLDADAEESNASDGSDLVMPRPLIVSAEDAFEGEAVAAAPRSSRFVESIGSLAGICTTAAFLPQVWSVWSTGNVSGLSLGMYIVFVTGVALWIAYGVCKGALPLAYANVITIVFSGCAARRPTVRPWSPLHAKPGPRPLPTERRSAPAGTSCGG